MSALGQKQTFTRLTLMSALPPKADIAWRGWMSLSVKISSVRLAEPLVSDVYLFGNCKRIVHFNAEVASRAFDLSVTKKELDGS
jgi:hypothetical protein